MKVFDARNIFGAFDRLNSDTFDFDYKNDENHPPNEHHHQNETQCYRAAETGGRNYFVSAMRGIDD